MQQTNTNGYKFQGTKEQLAEAEKMVNSWGKDGRKYSHHPDYQLKIKELLKHFPYRLDTNFAKMDRIEHPSLEEFKTKVLNTKFLDHRIIDWAKVISSGNEEDLNEYLFDSLSEE